MSEKQGNCGGGGAIGQHCMAQKIRPASPTRLTRPTSSTHELALAAARLRSSPAAGRLPRAPPGPRPRRGPRACQLPHHGQGHVLAVGHVEQPRAVPALRRRRRPLGHQHLRKVRALRVGADTAHPLVELVVRAKQRQVELPGSRPPRRLPLPRVDDHLAIDHARRQLPDSTTRWTHRQNNTLRPVITQLRPHPPALPPFCN